MRGEVLKPDDATGPGLILGEDGKRYHFTSARVHKGAALGSGSPVDFIALGEDARDIYPLGRTPSPVVNTSIDAAYAPAVAAKSEGMLKYFFRALSRNYFKFSGRARRAEYWGYLLFFVITLVVLFVVDAVISAAFFGVDTHGNPNFFPILTILFYIYNVIPGIALTVRRLHDQDMSGWLYLINFIPYLGGLIIFILMFFDSRTAPNKHGASPKYGAAQTVDVFA
ncbi:DUF805 domain-containing protein [Hyphomonas sp.]|uniref:DUF805 domain-containing protein n=1 Tax=Hyphomonas sp. TaxID=87 RepID=UPI0025C4A518|nr:DUF805 domain-containing protein [Hyphomonas sp.]MBA4337360.1 hypothetical protein [Hyphomonas sp.]